MTAQIDVVAPTQRRIYGSIVAVVAVAILAAAPFLLSSTAISSLSRILALALLAVSLDLLVGVSGMPSLGHAAPFGVGVYAGGLAAKSVSTWAPVPLLVAMLAGAVFAALTGVFIVRTRGTYFLMLTLAIAEVFHILADKWTSVTGGSNGLTGIKSISWVPGGEPIRLAGLRYYWILGIFLVGFAIVWWISHSAFGRSLRGIRDNEERMASLGYSAFTLKLAVYVISGAIAGAAGAAWVAETRFAAPNDLGFMVSAMALLAVVIGGRGKLWGAFLGAALVTWVRDVIGVDLGGRGPLLLGIVFILAVYLMPRGIAGTRWTAFLVRRRKEKAA